MIFKKGIGFVYTISCQNAFASSLAYLQTPILIAQEELRT